MELLKTGAANPRQDSETICVQDAIRHIWSDVLRVPADTIGPTDNFFTYGGDSLALQQVCEAVNTRFAASDGWGRVQITDLFTYATVRSCAEFMLRGASSPKAPAASDVRNRPEGCPVAIIGLAGRFPGALSVSELWDNLCQGTGSIRNLTDAELLAAGVAPSVLCDPRYVKRGAPLEGAALFDPAYFRVTPAEAKVMDPQQRILLECCVEALSDGGYGAPAGRGSVGVFVSSGRSAYVADLLAREPGFEDSIEGFAVLTTNTSPATRISYLLDLCGPSFGIDTACSSSLVAIHQACGALQRGECGLAIAGGASVGRLGARGYRYDDGGVVARDGVCRPFDRQANGTVFSSGAGTVLLKRLEDALSDNDSIYAVIRGSAINNDGRAKAGYIAPSVSGQESVIRAAQTAAGVEPESIGYVETHGTATPLGDSIEIAALCRVFGKIAEQPHCVLGAMKANIGHLEGASGIAGLIKASLVLRYGLIPPAILFMTANPETELVGSPFWLNRRLHRWERSERPRRAGVSSFGIGGTNAHVVLEEAPELPPTCADRKHHLLIVSARTCSAVHASCRNLACYLRGPGAGSLADVAYTLQVGREMDSHRAFVVTANRTEAATRLNTQQYPHTLTDSTEMPVVFMFPGLGSQHVQMLVGLYEHEPTYREEIDRCAELLIPQLNLDPRGLLLDGRATSDSLTESSLSNLLLFMVEFALAKLWIARGVRPSAMIAEGSAEYVVATLSGSMDVEDALRLVGMGNRQPSRVPADVIPEIATLMVGSRKAFLEVGPGNRLTTRACRIADAERHLIVSSARSSDDSRADDEVLLEVMGRLWSAGATIDWRAFNSRGAPRRVSLPTYPFERQMYCIPVSNRTDERMPDKRIDAKASRSPSADSQPNPFRDSESMLCEIWCKLFGVVQVGRDENFFDLGGDSMMVALMSSETEELMGMPVSFKQLLAHPTISLLAAAFRSGSTRSPLSPQEDA